MDDDGDDLALIDTDALLERFEGGESRALDEIWRRHYRRMRALADRYLQRYREMSDRSEADDLVQDVAGHLTKLAIRGELRGRTTLGYHFWLVFRDALRQCGRDKLEHDSARKRGGEGGEGSVGKGNGRTRLLGRRARPLVPDDLDRIASDEPGPDAIAAVEDVVEALCKQLDEEQAMVLTGRRALRTIPEIAAETGLSERTIARRLEEIRRIGTRSRLLD